MYDEDGFLRPGVFSFRTLEDCQAMIGHAGSASKAVVVGGGLLGLEAAKGLLERGLEVHVAHLGDYLMNSQLDAQAGAMLKQSLENLGLQIHLEKLTQPITPPFPGDPVGGLRFKDGEELECDMIVVAAGVRPNIDLAKQAGLHVQHGIVIQDDLSCRNDRNVYAIGECSQHRGKLFGLVAPPVGAGPHPGGAAYRRESGGLLPGRPGLHQAQDHGCGPGGHGGQGPANG